VRGRSDDADGDERFLCGLFALGDERTIEQDPAFALRIMVDIAIKALSAAINDPTTATQVLDHLTELLRLIGATRLEGHVRVMRDEDGAVRIVAPGRRWEDYLALACTEIREYGASAPEHRDAVVAELARLDETVELRFGSSVDADRAALPDAQGIGGPPLALRTGYQRLPRS
jgi:uncharacterized membrane protein